MVVFSFVCHDLRGGGVFSKRARIKGVFGGVRKLLFLLAVLRRF